MTWKCGSRTYDLTRQGLIMGILNGLWWPAMSGLVPDVMRDDELLQLALGSPTIDGVVLGSNHLQVVQVSVDEAGLWQIALDAATVIWFQRVPLRVGGSAGARSLCASASPSR